ncbi:general stress protein CsbD [Alishewanella sp. 16-MA]|uniref:General stress protein CsbD n=1 Tax=Alishewanella maricola TaxID=2795740 RepID=A0ABS8C1D2_9ALTE|nr:general stress protein CsbD [Alishewanella maricola]MCB5226131.1 general stress protein CsbD [Alishewanella maricola]
MSSIFAESQWSSVRAQVKCEWDKISYAELELTRNNPEYLTALVQERYNLEEDDARQRVQAFFDSL